MQTKQTNLKFWKIFIFIFSIFAPAIIFGAAPVITKQPENIVVKEGKSATFKVKASGSKLKYQWQVKADPSSDFVNITSKGTSSSYKVPAVSTESDFLKEYKCIVSNADGQAVSDSAHPIRLELPSFLLEPVDVNISLGDSCVFYAEAHVPSGPKVKFKWEVSSDGGNKWVSAGSSKRTLTLSKVKKDKSGNLYRCTISNELGKTVSNEALLMIIDAPATIKLQPKAQDSYEGAITEFKVLATPGCSYQWQISFNGGKDWEILEGETDAVLKYTFEREILKGTKYKVRCLIQNEATSPGVILTTNAVSSSVYNKVNISSVTYTQDKQTREIVLDPESEQEFPEIVLLSEMSTTITMYASGHSPKYEWFESYDGGENWSKLKSTKKTLTFKPEVRDHRLIKAVTYNGDHRTVSEFIFLVSIYPQAYKNVQGKILALNFAPPEDSEEYDEEEIYPWIEVYGKKSSDAFVNKNFGAIPTNATITYKRVSPFEATFTLKYTDYTEPTENTKAINEKISYKGVIRFLNPDQYSWSDEIFYVEVDFMDNKGNLLGTHGGVMYNIEFADTKLAGKTYTIVYGTFPDGSLAKDTINFINNTKATSNTNIREGLSGTFDYTYSTYGGSLGVITLKKVYSDGTYKRTYTLMYNWQYTEPVYGWGRMDETFGSQKWWILTIPQFTVTK